MRIYTYHSNQTTPPAELDFASKRRADFARQAVRLEFRARDARAIDYGGFRDRKPHERPRLSPACWRGETNGTKRVELADLIGQVGA